MIADLPTDWGHFFAGDHKDDTQADNDHDHDFKPF